MRKSLKVSRSLQVLGAALWVGGIVSCSTRGDPSSMSWMFIGGLLLIVGARLYEWFTKE